MIKNNIFILIVALFFSSCQFEKVIDNPDLLEHTPLLAVTALISPIDSVPQIFISKTIGITDEEPFRSIDDATIFLYKDETLYDTYTYNPIEKYYFGTKPFFENEGKFRLEVNALDFDSVFAEQVIPEPIEFLNIEIIEDGGPLINGGGTTDEMNLIFQDNPSVENFYELIVFGTFTFDSLNLRNVIRIESINDNLIPLDKGSLIFSNNGQSGQEFGVSIYSERFHASTISELRIFLSRITKDKYLYLKTYQKYLDNGGSLFSEPIIVHSNVQNGEGIFTVESIISDTIKF